MKQIIEDLKDLLSLLLSQQKYVTSDGYARSKKHTDSLKRAIEILEKDNG